MSSPPYATWEMLVIGALALLIVLWFRPGIRSQLARSREAPARWGDVVLPLGLVVLFVVFLIMLS